MVALGNALENTWDTKRDGHFLHICKEKQLGNKCYVKNGQYV